MKKILYILLFIPVGLFGQVAGAWLLNGNATDASGNSNNGTAVGVSWSGIQGMSSGAAGYSIGAYITLGATNYFSSNASPASITAWFYVTFYTSGYHMILAYGNAAVVNKAFMLYLHGSAMGGGGAGRGIEVSGLVTNTWYFGAATYDGTYVRVYLNGKEISTSPSAQTFVVTPLSGGWIGDDGYNERMDDGKLDNVRVYNVCLTPAQIKNEYLKGKGSFQ